MIAAALALLAGEVAAQIARPRQPPPHPSGPGWGEFHDLSARLNAVEAENRWLRNGIVRG